MKKITWKISMALLRLNWPYQKIHHFFISLSKNKNETKIFCIGGPKTGTTSLYKALKILGYRSVRLFDWPTYYKQGEEKYIEKIKKSSYEAFGDLPFGYKDFYKKLDAAIPGSIFILTVRDDESLKKSYYNFYKNSPWFDNMIKYLSEEITGKRTDNIICYFKGRESKFLVMNIIDGDGWEKLCKFLNKPISNRPFPHEIKGNYKQ